MVSVNGAESGRRGVEYKVLQGSVLELLLFLIIVNELADGRSELLFADNTTLLSRGDCDIVLGPLQIMILRKL